MYYITVCNKVDNDGTRWQEQIVKSYPTKEQCYIWLFLHKYVYLWRKGMFIDKRFRIVQDFE